MREMALDRHIRFCPVCLSLGLHFAEFQILALRCCPAHQIPLTQKCTVCNAPSPRYALTLNTFHAPFFCECCGHPLATSFSPGNFNAGSETAKFIAGQMQPLRNWVQKVGRLGLVWEETDKWALTELQSRSDEARKSIYTQVAMLAIPRPRNCSYE